ncbi:hypothetical protein THMIRHAS_15490 [Thiosulfatimonas sediminis]|uniref:Uncharacterized protein n=2 Tax=Thiosulfatimonas sediminis TaxID=2675054 RepID=A0A6F8PVQ1_9GAMM|nr:hypothetical protein THMIRHAS_15490 [Thiosulfatimonas sediminis]
MLLLAACQAKVIDPDTKLQLTDVVPASWVKLPAQSIALNASIELPNLQGDANEAYLVQSLYMSALGKPCMQVAGTQSGLRVFCQTVDNYWQPMPYFNQVTF